MGTELFTITDVTRKGRPAKWGLDYYSPWDLKPDGKKERKKEFFRTKKERVDRRDALMDRFARYGASAGAELTPVQIDEYRTAKGMLPAGVMLQEAARVYMVTYRPSGPVLTDFIASYVESMRARNLEATWINQVKKTCDRFSATLPEKIRITDITTDHIRAWMKALEGSGETSGTKAFGYGAESRNNFRRRLHGAFEWAVMERILAENPVARVDAPPIRRGKPVFYTVAETRAILAAAVLTDRKLVRFFVLRIFAGVRGRQIQRMIPSDIILDRRIIDLPGWRKVETKSRKANGASTTRMMRVTKDGKRHVIQKVPPVLWDWLERFPDLDVANLQNRVRAVMKVAGVAPKKNGHRHSFATHHVNLEDSAAKTMLILGQEEDSKAFFDHYHNYVEHWEAVWYFDLYLQNVIPFVFEEIAAERASSDSAASGQS